MYRKAIEQLKAWKDSTHRKPLVLRGARQVGKTWLMNELGSSCYEKTFYFNFEKEEFLKDIFKNNKNPTRFLELLGILKEDKILPGKHLIIFDEIQECPDALNALKYINEEANEYHVIAAGSLLGTYLAQPHSYPVGKVNLIDIYPMDFEEFLAATAPSLYDLIQKDDTEAISLFHDRFVDQYNNYLIIGGMPECVSSWIEEKNTGIVGQIQDDLIELYENDITKHSGKINSGRILLVFRSIVSLLSKENEKFIYGCVKEGARAREFEDAIEWLVSAGMIIRVFNISKPEHPLKAFETLSSFKLFFFDTGLLKHMAGVSNESIISGADFQFKGPLTENYVCQQLRGLFEVDAHYYSPVQNYELDFIIQNESQIIPIECKGGKNITSASFKRYIKENSPEQAVRYSLLPYKEQENMVNIPLYYVGKIKK